jgi:hypothetical protein
MRVEIDDEIEYLLESLSDFTGLSPSEIVTKLLTGHLGELFEYEALLESCKGNHAMFQEAVNLLVSYGPDTLLQGIKRVQPGYLTYEDRIIRERQERGSR